MPIYQVFKPDKTYFQNKANAIARMSKVPESTIASIQVNCGSGGCLGWVVLKSGERIEV